MAIRDQEGDSGGDWWAQQAPPPTNWWEGPPPAGYSGPWPPALPPGASYGPNLGQVIYGAPTPATETPGYTAPTGDTTSPNYHPEYFAKPPNPAGGTGGGGGGGGTTTPTSPIGVPTTGFGAAPTPYASDPNAPVYNPMPTYVPPMWTGGDYQNPTEAELYASPGYQSRLNAGLMGRARSAAAQGTILNGGTQKALERYGQDYANNEYQTLRNNTFEAYKQRYSQFQDAAGMDLGARTINANENQNTFQNRTNTYVNSNSRTLSDYLTNLTGKRNAENDYWSRLQDLNQTGAGLAGGSR